jgi:CRP-like cAMP-binding protein
MEEHVYQGGSEIFTIGDKCTDLIFVVNGVIELELSNENGDTEMLAELIQGDLFGQYAVLFQEELTFSAIAKTMVRVLTLPAYFFTTFG